MDRSVPSGSESGKAPTDEALPSSRDARPTHIQSPADHARVLHPDGSIGLITLARRVNGRWREQRIPAETLPDVVGLLSHVPDVYLSQNRFRGPRQIAHLLALDALWVDLDYQYVEEFAHCSPEGMRQVAYETLSDARVPPPSYTVATGRGLALVWLHEPVPRTALPRWRACQRTLHHALAELGADRAALDPARVLRVVGTENPKAGRGVTALTSVRAVWPFDALADEILPMTRTEIHDLQIQRALRASQKPSEGKNVAPQGFTTATLWAARLTDLQTLLELRWWGQLPPGHRDIWLFLAGVAMSWISEPFLMQRELTALAQQVGHWNARQVASHLHGVLKRAEQAQHGETISYHGQAFDPRYHFRTETILEWLDITPEEQAHMATLVAPEVARARHREAERERKHRAGEVKQDRQSYVVQATERREERREQARILREAGKSYRAIATALGCSVSEAHRLLHS